jgi:putative protein kinase ArgK-like GTPase of G3E family
VNKADRPGADTFLRELEAALHLDPRAASNPVPIVKTSALDGLGLQDLTDRIVALSSDPEWKRKRVSPARLKAEAQSLLRLEAEREIEKRVQSVSSNADFARLFQK